MKVKIIKIHPKSAHYADKDCLLGAIGEFSVAPFYEYKKNKYIAGNFQSENPISCYPNLNLEDLNFFFFKVMVEEIK